MRSRNGLEMHEQLQTDYQRDGVICVRQLLPPAALSELRANLDRYMNVVVPRLAPGDRTLEADGTTVRNLWRMERNDPFFESFARRADVLDLVAPLVRGEPVLMGVETFNKPPKLGSGVPPHQDNAYFCQSPPDVLTVWLAIDAATPANGPVFYLKGSHTAGVLPHRPSGVAGNSMGLAAMPPHDRSAEYATPLEPGDALIHHCQTIHWSAPNKTDQPRCGLLLVYRGAHTNTDPQLQHAYAAARAAQAHRVTAAAVGLA